MKTRLVIIVCAGYIFWQVFLRRLYYSTHLMNFSVIYSFCYDDGPRTNSKRVHGPTIMRAHYSNPAHYNYYSAHYSSQTLLTYNTHSFEVQGVPEWAVHK